MAAPVSSATPAAPGGGPETKQGAGLVLIAVLGVGLMAIAIVLTLTGSGDGDAPPGGDAPTGPPGATVRPTQQASPSVQIAATAGLLRRALSEVGFRLDLSARPYQPSEPLEVAAAQRAVYRVSLADPNEGFVVIYEFVDVTSAAGAGRAFAAYLESGFGQTNYPFDAQFTLTQVGGTLVFSWWSPESADDAGAAERAFAAIASVGSPIPVVR